MQKTVLPGGWDNASIPLLPNRGARRMKRRKASLSKRAEEP